MQRAATNENVFTSDDKPVISVDNAKFTWDKNDAAVLNEFVNIAVLIALLKVYSCAVVYSVKCSFIFVRETVINRCLIQL